MNKKIILLISILLVVFFYFKSIKSEINTKDSIKEKFDSETNTLGSLGSSCGSSNTTCNTGLFCVDNNTGLVTKNSSSAQCKTCNNLSVDPSSLGNFVSSVFDMTGSLLAGGKCKS